MGSTTTSPGAGITTDGNALMVFIAVWLSFATIGLSLILIPALWVGEVAYAAYAAPDHHGAHPWLHVWKHRWAHTFRGRAKH